MTTANTTAMSEQVRETVRELTADELALVTGGKGQSVLGKRNPGNQEDRGF
jgi:hypothetical protein